MSRIKCRNIDMLEYLEGRASEETVLHIESCAKCQKEAARLSSLMGIISTKYAAGKKIERELDKKLKTMNLAGMKKLPDNIAGKIEAMRESSIKARLKKVVAKGRKEAAGLVDGLLSSDMHAMPASPKDITKARKKKPAAKKKRVVKKKE